MGSLTTFSDILDRVSQGQGQRGKPPQVPLIAILDAPQKCVRRFTAAVDEISEIIKRSNSQNQRIILLSAHLMFK